MSLLFHPGQRIATKAIDKVIAKETKKATDENRRFAGGNLL